MDILVKDAYAQYGHYVNSNRAMPLIDDGLKPVERRILLTSYEIAKDKFVKSARILGTTMAKYHPHSESYSTLFQLVKNGFIEGQGNWGSSLGVSPIDPAAPRYTEAKLKKETIEMAFKLIKYIPLVESELDDEPEYIPTKYPFCLMGNEYVQGIGFGYKTNIPCYEIDDLKARLFWLLSDKKGIEPVIKPKTECKILAKESELKELLTIGKAKIAMKGVLQVEKFNNRVILKSWLPGRRFESIIKKPVIKKYLDTQDIGFIDSSSGDNGTKIIFMVLKKKNIKKILDNFTKHLNEVITGEISFECIAVRDGEIAVTSIDEMLLNTYDKFRKANEYMLKNQIEKVKISIDDLTVLNKIKPFLIEILSKNKTFLKNKSVSDLINILSKKSGIEDEIVKQIINKYNIQKLLTFQDETDNLKDKLKQLYKTLENLDKFTIGQY